VFSLTLKIKKLNNQECKFEQNNATANADTNIIFQSISQSCLIQAVARAVKKYT